MIKLSLSSLWARRRRAIGTSLAVLLGVAFLSGTLVLGDTLGANFDRLFTEVSAETSVVVRNATAVDSDRGPNADRGLVDESLVDTIRSVDGVRAASGEIVGYGSLLGADGDPIGGNGPPRQAGSWTTVPSLNPYKIVAGRAPGAPGEVVINRGAAKAGDLHLGDRTTVQTPQPVPVEIVGIATFGDADGVGTSTFTAFTLADAQAQVIRQPGLVSSVVVRGDGSTSDTELRDRIRAELPAGIQAITGQQLTDERIDEISSTFLDLLRTLLVVFAGVALMVATLSINNTFSITVAQRTRELALLRAVGASRRQIRASVAIEALTIGVVSAAVGVLAGLGVAGLLKGMFDAFGFALPAGGLAVEPMSLLIAAAVGVVATFVAAQLPARRAARVAPIAALREAGSEARHLGRGRVLGAVVVTAVGLAASIGGAASATVLMTALGSVVLVVGVLLLAPLVLTPVAIAFGAVLRRVRGASGLLAEQNARRNPRRSASTATALVIGVAVVSLFTLFAASLKATLDESVRTGVSAELVVATEAFGGNRLAPGLADDLRRLPEVERAVGIGGGGVILDGETTVVTATTPKDLPAVLELDTVAGAFERVGRNGIAISKGEADDRGWQVGTPTTITFPGGDRERVTVRAVYDDAELLTGVVVPSALWVDHAVQPTDSAVLVRTSPGTDLDAARRAIAPLATRDGGDVQDLDEFVASTTGGLDMLLNIVYVMLALAIVIALLGIANALSLAVYERRSELGLLRAVGETRRQVRSMLRLESVIVSTFGTVLGLALGGALGALLFATVSDDGSLAVPLTRLAVIAVIGALAGIVAALRPARRAARMPILDAIAAP